MGAVTDKSLKEFIRPVDERDEKEDSSHSEFLNGQLFTISWLDTLETTVKYICAPQVIIPAQIFFSVPL